MKKQQKKIKSLAYWLIIGFLGLFLIGGFAKAQESGFSWANVERLVAEMLFGKANDEDSDGLLGAAGARFPNGISADATSPSVGEVRGADLTSTDDVTVGDDLTISGDRVVQNTLDTFVIEGAMADATNTLFCVSNPHSATSTADFAGIFMTNYATSTHSLIVTTSTASTGLTTSSLSLATSLINAVNVTSTGWVSITSGVVANNFAPVNSYATQKMLVKPSEFVCGITGEGDGGTTAGITNTNNTFSGRYKVRFIR